MNGGPSRQGDYSIISLNFYPHGCLRVVETGGMGDVLTVGRLVRDARREKQVGAAQRAAGSAGLTRAGSDLAALQGQTAWRAPQLGGGGGGESVSEQAASRLLEPPPEAEELPPPPDPPSKLATRRLNELEGIHHRITDAVLAYDEETAAVGPGVEVKASLSAEEGRKEAINVVKATIGTLSGDLKKRSISRTHALTLAQNSMLELNMMSSDVGDLEVEASKMDDPDSIIHAADPARLERHIKEADSKGDRLRQVCGGIGRGGTGR